ncbi:hypothetical protein BDZ45DRAFT_679851 [Acephala macrosclerotiorum]|nr:hypothetical protein BDZ45DRAFT_679851 [Acephala macrosclerotiorum]
MDGLSAAASIIAVIQIAQAVGSGLKDYYESVRDAREDIQKFYNAIKSLEIIFENIQKLLQLPGGQLSLSETVFTDPSSPLKQCHAELKEMASILGSSNQHRAARKVVQSLLWPFKKKDVEKRVLELEMYKSSLMLSVGLDNLYKMSDTFDIAKDILSDIRAARKDEDRNRIMVWLTEGVPNPSKEHNEARNKHEKTTGSWLLDSNEFKKWSTTRNSFLWLNGNAGVGKSILCSTVIDHIQQCTAQETNTAVVYWYFSFTDKEKQNLSSVLCSFIADICSNRRDTPEELIEAYRRCNFGHQKPDFEALKYMLKSVVDGFENIYLIVDALDECQKAENQREIFLGLLGEIVASWQLQSLHLLVTSRRELDIQESFSSFPDLPCTFANLSVEGRRVERDIMKFLEHRLQHQTFRAWKPSLKESVKQDLAKKADGMFRLVALQLDALSRIRTEGKIRNAMEVLPRSLEAFYDRMLQEIEDLDDQEYTRRAFLWIAYSARPVTLVEVAEAIVVSPQYPQKPSIQEARFLDCQDLLRIIPSGLVSVVGTIIQFAHFSVKEYLISPQKSAQRLQKYEMTHLAANHEISAVCIAYLLEAGRDPLTQPGSPEMYESFPLLKYAATSWTYHAQSLTTESITKQLSNLVLEFMQYESDAWRLWSDLAFDDRLYHARGGQFKDPVDENNKPWGRDKSSKTKQNAVHPITWSSAAGLESILPLVLARLRINLNAIPATRYLGKPLFAAARAKRRHIVDLFLSQRVEANDSEFNPLLGACEAKPGDFDIPVVQALLYAGASVNAIGRYGNALQTAAYCGAAEGLVVLLLENGAEVNANGGIYGTALLAAICRGHKQIARRLIAAGADIRVSNSRGNVLQNAAKINAANILRLLIEAGADVNATSRADDRPALRIAIDYRHVECLKAILETPALEIEHEEWNRTYETIRMIISEISAIENARRGKTREAHMLDIKKAVSLRDLLRHYAVRHGLPVVF